MDKQAHSLLPAKEIGIGHGVLPGRKSVGVRPSLGQYRQIEDTDTFAAGAAAVGRLLTQ